MTDPDHQINIAREAMVFRQHLRNFPGFMPPKSCEIVARRMGIILGEVDHNQGLSRKKIAREHWNDEWQSKRFYKFAIRFGDTLPEKQLKYLTKGAREYADLTDAIARLAGISPDALLVRLFRGTVIEERAVLGTSGKINLNEEATRAISDDLDRMTDFLSRKAKLADHAQRMLGLRDSARYDVLLDRLTPGGRFLHYGPLARNYELLDEMPPIPSVPLFRELRTAPFQTTLAVASEPVEPSIFFQSCQNSDHAAWTSREVTVYAWREVRLAIGPGSALDAVEPLIEVRTQFELREDEEVIPIFNAWQYGSGEACFGLWCDDQLHPAVASLDKPDDAPDLLNNWIPLELDPIVATKFGKDLPHGKAIDIIKDDENDTGLFLQPEHVYATWMPATESYIGVVFAPDMENGLHEWLLEPEAKQDSLLAHPKSLAAKLETVLLDKTLERALKADAKQKVSMVEAFEAESLGAARAAHAEAHARWGVSEFREDDEEESA